MAATSAHSRRGEDFVGMKQSVLDNLFDILSNCRLRARLVHKDPALSAPPHLHHHDRRAGHGLGESRADLQPCMPVRVSDGITTDFATR